MKHSILVAEDNLINQKILEALLKKSGYQVLVVSNGLEVLESLREKFFDVVIMDYQMPQMNGIDTIRVIRETFDEKVNSIPIIFLTSELNQDALSELSIFNVTAIFEKPVEPDILINSLSKLLKCSPKADKRTSANVRYLQNITDGNRALMAEIIGLFIEEVPLGIDKMKNLCKLKDWSGIKKVIHKIVSNYKIVGIDDYEDALKSLEVDLEKGVNCESYLDRINDLEQNTLQAIEELLVKKEKLMQ